MFELLYLTQKVTECFPLLLFDLLFTSTSRQYDPLLPPSPPTLAILQSITNRLWVSREVSPNNLCIRFASVFSSLAVSYCEFALCLWFFFLFVNVYYIRVPKIFTICQFGSYWNYIWRVSRCVSHYVKFVSKKLRLELAPLKILVKSSYNVISWWGYILVYQTMLYVKFLVW